MRLSRYGSPYDRGKPALTPNLLDPTGLTSSEVTTTKTGLTSLEMQATYIKRVKMLNKKLIKIVMSVGFLSVLTVASQLKPAQAQSIEPFRTFEVCANEPDGQRIATNSNYSQVRVEASGLWTGGGANPVHGPSGTSRTASHRNQLPLPTGRTGALVAISSVLNKGGGHSVYEVGSEATLDWHSDSSYTFKMNDYGWDNNSGCLNINLYGISSPRYSNPYTGFE